MRLTLRTLLAFRNGLLAGPEAAEMAARVDESPVAKDLLARIECLPAENLATELRTGPQSDPNLADANTLAAYVDNALGPAEVIDFENRCLGRDSWLAELTAVHQLCVVMLSQPADLNAALRTRLESLGSPAALEPPIAPPLELPVETPAPAAAIPMPPPLPLFMPAPTPPPLPIGPWAMQVMSPELAPPVMQPGALLSVFEQQQAAAEPEPEGTARGLWPRLGNWCAQHGRYYVQSAAAHLLLFVVVGVVAGNVTYLKRDGLAPAFDTVIDPGLSPSDSPLELGNWTATTDSKPPPALAPLTGGQSASMPESSELFSASPAGSSVSMAGSASTLGGQAGGGWANPSSNGALASNRPLSWATGASKGAGGGRPGRPAREKSSAGGGGVVAAEGVGSAVDGILSGIRGELITGDLLVVWLLDASLSLYDDRQQVAARIEPFYKDLEARRGSSHKLMNAAVAFGANTVELIAPTPHGQKIVQAVAGTPIDNTGLENVMTAVDQVVYKYRKSWRAGMLIIVWTDESGDDTLQLEDTIALCRKQGVGVSVVGPSSAFGSEIGVHPYIDGPTGYRFLLPIKRGPDTSFAERLLLAYWHDSALPPWTMKGAQVGDNVPWYGGPYREGLLSGVGPYALTRLALETGGKYTLLDHEYTRAPFKFEDMKAYLPDYGSADEYLRMLRYHPLRKAVFDVVQLTYDQQKLLQLPKLSFISQRGMNYPFNIHNVYTTPADFRRLLTTEFASETAKLAAASSVFEAGLARFGADGMEKEYEHEDALRWRAWYDLTRGRLLAMSVRNVEYKLTCQMVLAQANWLNAETNHIFFDASPELKSADPAVLKAAAEARRLLERCVQKNPDTPWAYLAQWELDRGLGLSVRQIAIPQPRPSGGGGRPAAAMPSLPNL